MMRASSIMGTSVLTMKNLSAYDCLVSNGTYMQSVRWKRKPIWLPTAKSKVFRVPKRPVIPIEESAEIARLYNNYRTYMKSLLTHFHIEGDKSQVKTSAAVIQAQEKEDFIRCTAINDKWNVEVAKEREVRLAREWEERELRIKEKLVKKKQRDEVHLAKIEENVRKMKEAAPQFITAENVDAAIEQSLDTIVNYNRAIDMDGKFYDGTISGTVQTQTNVSQPQVQQ